MVEGQRVLIAYGNGLLTRYAYDVQRFRLVHLRTERYAETEPYRYTLSGPPLQAFGYLHDLVDNVLAIGDRAPGSGLPAQPDRLDRAFVYDPAYRLLSATGRECAAPPPSDPWQDPVRCQTVQATQPYAERYDYDAVGNLTNLHHQAATSFARQLPPVAGSNRLQSLTVGGMTYSYDYDSGGNLTREGTSRQLEWDHANRLRVFRQQAAGAAPTLVAHYLYDAAGQRVKKLVRTASNRWETTVYVDATFERHVEQRPGATRQNAEVHLRDGSNRVALRRTGDALTGDAFPTVPGGVLYHLADHLGSSHFVADAAGAALNREEYTPYGETSFGSFARKRYRFTGKERDGESGFAYHGFRYYGPWCARWASTDPAGLTDGPNRYRYAQNSPIVTIDPDGRTGAAPSVSPTTPPTGGPPPSVFNPGIEEGAARLAVPGLEGGATAAEAAPAAGTAGTGLLAAAGWVLLGIAVAVSLYASYRGIKYTNEQANLSPPSDMGAPPPMGVDDTPKIAPGAPTSGPLNAPPAPGEARVEAPPGHPATPQVAPAGRDPTNVIAPGARPSSPAVAAGERGPSGKDSTRKYLENNWDKATFGVVRKSIDYHVNKHGKGRWSAVQVTQIALKAFRDPTAKKVATTDNQGRPAVKVSSSQFGAGLFTPRGRIIWFQP